MKYFRKMLAIVMVKWFSLISCFLFLLLFCSCKMGLANPLPRTVVLNGCLYEAVQEDRIQELDLSVGAVSDLSAAGEVKDLEDQTERMAYAYPDQRFPNLLVVPIHDEPTIFQFSNFTHISSGEINNLIQIYGINSQNSIRKIIVYKQNEGEKAFIQKEIEDTETLISFYNWLQTIEAQSTSPSEDDSLYWPAYRLDIELTNGYIINSTVYPNACCFYCACVYYDCGAFEANWLTGTIS